MTKSKHEKVDGLLDELGKAYKKSKFQRGSNEELRLKHISTGVKVLDKALEGGFPLGRMVEIYGGFLAGKTTLTFLTMANAQKKDMLCAYVDAERRFNSVWAERLGVDLDKLIVVKPRTAEDAMEIVEELLYNKFDIIAIDSIVALIPQEELEEDDYTKVKVALLPRILGKAVKRIAVMNQSSLVILINQVRERIGVMYGSREKRPGGKALDHYSSTILKVAKGKWIVKAGEKIGVDVRCIVEKNDSPPKREAHFELFFEDGKIREVKK